MKRMIIGLSLGLVPMLAPMLVAQPATFYVNDGVVQCPPDIRPQIDAVNFINNNFFGVNAEQVEQRPFNTAHTLNFTNRATMQCNLGFDLSTYVPEAVPPVQPFQMAATVHNIGTISAGTSDNPYSLGIGVGKLLITASNIYSPGSLLAGQDCFLSLRGRNVDLNHGLVVMDGFTDQSPADNLLGFFSGYWGVGTNVMPAYSMPQPQTPFHEVTNRFNQVYAQRLRLTNAVAYASSLVSDNGSNIFTRAVFLRNTNLNMAVRVYLPEGFFSDQQQGRLFKNPIVVEWAWTRASLFSTTPTNDYLYLLDDMGTLRNPALFYVGNSGPRPTFQPGNFGFRRGEPEDYGPPENAIQSLSLPSSGRTNDSMALQVLFQPTSVVIQDTAGQNATNLPGRIQIVGSERVDLEYARIGGPNTMELTSTNHFVGSKGAQIAVPLAQITLRNTNGLLAITNLMSPTIPRPEGTVDLYSCRWTNEVGGITNTIHALFVESEFSPGSPGRIQDLTLSATNLIVSDVLNIQRYFVFDGTHLTLTSNGPNATVPAAGINLLSTTIVWSNAFPRLSYLTNHGDIRTLNAVYFGGARTSPFYSTNYNEPYEAMVNRGSVMNEGALIWSKYFENAGSFHCGSGSLTLDAWAAWLVGGYFQAEQGDLNLTSGSLVVSNHALLAGRTINLTVTNYISDGGVVTNGNTWVTGLAGSSVPGFNLFLKPPAGDLLVTTVSNYVPAYGNYLCQWAAEDRGRSNTGYTNNAAVGRLILDGGENSRFTFRGTGVSNALYVDYLEFRDYTTTTILNESGNIEEMQIDPNMMVYYAQAMAADGSVAERIDGANGGRLRWMKNYAGFYSSTNLVYSDGTTNSFNAALVSSQNLDSDGDGIPNNQDLTPILRSPDLQLAVSLVRQPGLAAALSWRTVPDAINHVYFQNALGAANWEFLTNFNSGPLSPGPAGVRVSVTNLINPGNARFYRVRVDVP